MLNLKFENFIIKANKLKYRLSQQFLEKLPTMQPYRFYYFETLIQAKGQSPKQSWIPKLILHFFYYLCVFNLIQPQTTIIKKNATKHKNSHGLQGKKQLFNLIGKRLSWVTLTDWLQLVACNHKWFPQSVIVVIFLSIWKGQFYSKLMGRGGIHTLFQFSQSDYLTPGNGRYYIITQKAVQCVYDLILVICLYSCSIFILMYKVNAPYTLNTFLFPMGRTFIFTFSLP